MTGVARFQCTWALWTTQYILRAIVSDLITALVAPYSAKLIIIRSQYAGLLNQVKMLQYQVVIVKEPKNKACSQSDEMLNLGINRRDY
jgi:hypothetical protein